MPKIIKVDTSKIIDAYIELGSIKAVAQQFGISYGTVRSRLIKAGVSLKHQGNQTIGLEPMSGADRMRRVRLRNIKTLHKHQNSAIVNIVE